MKQINSTFILLQDHFLLLCVIIFIWSSIYFPDRALSQQFVLPSGESIRAQQIGHDQITGSTYRKVVTNKGTYYGLYDLNSKKWDLPKYYPIGIEEDIAIVSKQHRNESALSLCLRNGEVLIMRDSMPMSLGTLPLNMNEQVLKITGEGMYALTTNNIFYRNSVLGWNPDTSEISTFTRNDIELDTEENVYLAANEGLYRQDPLSTKWTALSLPDSSSKVFTVYFDRHDIMFIAVEVNKIRMIYNSSDHGHSWEIDTLGFNGMRVKQFTDDAFGNHYAIAQALPFAQAGNAIFRRKFSDSLWERIDEPVSKLNRSGNPFIFNDISGDSLLGIATNIGSFYSIDRGTTWVTGNDGIFAQELHGLIKVPSGAYLVSTNIGLFSLRSADTAWQKVLPLYGYKMGSAIYRDNSGKLYTVAESLSNAGVSQSASAIYNSTNDGLTWTADTLSQPKTGAVYFVGQNGTQYQSLSKSGFGTSYNLFKKPQGQSWIHDEQGIDTSSPLFVLFIGEDATGKVYLSTYANTGILYSQTVSGGAWIRDDSGLNGASVYAITSDKYGDIIAATSKGIYLRSMSNPIWTKPDGQPGRNTFTVSVDSSGRIWTSYASPNSSGKFVGIGLYYSLDRGKSWIHSSGGDTVTYRFLVSYGDTTYGITFFDGIRFGTTSLLGDVGQSSYSPENTELKQSYPNPASGVIHIDFILPGEDRITIALYDLLGKKIAGIANGQMTAGLHNYLFDASTLAPGMYNIILHSTNGALRSSVIVSR